MWIAVVIACIAGAPQASTGTQENCASFLIPTMWRDAPTCRAAADLIDCIEDIPLPDGEDAAYRNFAGEVARLRAHAQTLAEDAAMNAVKAATKQPWPREK